jgi:transcriptional regulator with XRE-family HTH domain
VLRGEQLRAARALLRWTHKELAERASQIEPVSVDALRKWEAIDGPIRGIAPKLNAVVTVLEAAGVELLNHGQPGARLKAQPAQA